MIRENTFGELMESNRKEKNVKRTKLCRGLCTIMALSRYENDERMPEKIIADSLLERLGIFPYQFEFVLSDEEYRQIMLRKEIENAVWEDAVKIAKDRINQYKSSIKSCRSLHMQYVLLKEGEILKKEGNLKMAIGNLQKAMQCTEMEEALKESGSGILLTNIETELLFQMAECLYLTGDRQQSNNLFHILKRYLEEYSWDNDKRVMYYPHILYRMSQFACQDLNFGLAEEMLVKAKEEIIREYQLWDLYEIIVLLKEVQERLGKKFTQEDENIMNALKIVNMSREGELAKEGIELWQSTVNQQL